MNHWAFQVWTWPKVISLPPSGLMIYLSNSAIPEATLGEAVLQSVFIFVFQHQVDPSLKQTWFCLCSVLKFPSYNGLLLELMSDLMTRGQSNITQFMMVSFKKYGHLVFVAKVSVCTRVQDSGVYPLILLGLDKLQCIFFHQWKYHAPTGQAHLYCSLDLLQNPFFLWAPIKADILSRHLINGPEQYS